MTTASGIARSKTLTCLLAGALLLCGIAPDPSAEPAPLSQQIFDSNQRLSELRKQITSHRDQVDRLLDEERDAAAKLSHLTEEMKLAQGLLAGLDEREKILEQQKEQVQEQLSIHQAEYAQRQQAMAKRLCSLYVHGAPLQLQLLLTAESFSSLLTRLKYATMVARLDGSLMEQTRQQGQDIILERKELQAALAGIWEAREETLRERRRLEEVDAERRAVLDELKQEKSEVQSELAQLQKSEKSLLEVLDGLENARTTTVGTGPRTDDLFGQTAGNLDWPATGRLTGSFGSIEHPEFHTITISNGITISAPAGAPVFAVAAGTVEFSEQLPGFGLCVILDHGAGYYTLYGHLGQLFVRRSDSVSRGEIVAELGESTGDGGSELYFEIRNGKTPMDPLKWLKPPGR